jgi:hypothetical protein
MAAKHLRPGARQRDLADGGGGLTIFELERSRRQFQHRAAKRDGAGGDHEHVALVAVELGNVLGKRQEPSVMQSPAVAVDQERGADFYHHAAEVGEGEGAGHLESLRLTGGTRQPLSRRYVV